MGTLGSLKMSISSRRNTDFHVFYLRKCDLEIGTRTNSKKLSFWKDFGLHFCDLFLLKRVLKASKKKVCKQVRQKLRKLFFWGCPAECAVAGERLDRGQKSKKVRILEKVIGRSFSSHHLSTLVQSWSSTLVPSLRSGRRIASRIPPGHFERAGGRSVNFQFGKMQFTCFRRATFEITVYSFSRRDFLYCNLLVFVALLSKLHFTSSRGADFEIAVHSFSLRQFRN